MLAAVAFLATAVCALAATTGADAQADAKAEKKAAVKDHLQNHFKLYGFIRTYAPFDTRESTAGSGDLFYWIPKDVDKNASGEDLNELCSFRFLALTSRVGLDVSGYQVGDTQFGAKVEADFYAGLSGSTGAATMRLRQAFMTLKWTNPDDNKYTIGFKAGQAWHPMAADLPDIFSLDSGMPFGPFSRTPQMTADFNLGSNLTLTASALWQMQYSSAGPDGQSANYIRYSCTPEVYAGITCKAGGFLGRLGVDVCSIKPRSIAGEGPARVKAKDRETSVLGMLYLQYTKDLFKIKAKSIFGGAGEQMNLMSGYAICSRETADNWQYTPINASSSWLTIAYGKKVQGAILLGYMKNLGTFKDIAGYKVLGIADASAIYFQKNGSPNINQMFRIQPEITYNVGKFTLGLEYMATGVQYGKKVYNLRALSTEDLHWVVNNRIQAVVKFTF